MRLTEAVELIRRAAPGPGGVWADLGSGTGLFALALAELLGPAGRVLAVDRDARALAELRRAGPAAGAAEVVTLQGDFQRLAAVEALSGLRLDGALFANALHFAPDAGAVLADVARRLDEGGRVVVVEYEGRPASRWVPYPLSVERLRGLAEPAGLAAPRVVGQRPSAYGGIMYCAVLGRLSPPARGA